jgi:hypothetical protein
LVAAIGHLSGLLRRERGAAEDDRAVADGLLSAVDRIQQVGVIELAGSARLMARSWVPMTAAPASRAVFASQGRFWGTRTSGATWVPAVAAIIAWAVSIEIGPCSMSIISQSNPECASSCAVAALGIVTPTP